MRGQLSEVDRLRTANSYLRRENQELRQEIKELKATAAQQAQTIETLKLQLEELQRIVFGKNKKPKDPTGNQPPTASVGGLPRPKDSFRRPVPQEGEVTDIKDYPIVCCPDCQGSLSNIRSVIRYQEDIVLPAVKTVTKQNIRIGFCPLCHKSCQAIPVSSQLAVLGPNIKQAVLYWTYVSRMSFQQITDLARDFYRLSISDGEIASILSRSSDKLALSYEQLKQRVRGSPSLHFDETGYKEQGGEKFAWVMAPSHSEEAVFMVGRNRGRPNAEELMGGFKGVRITDCYGAYDNLPGQHQACWAHPLRQARDLAAIDDLPQDKRLLCQEFYHQVKETYTQVRNIVASPFEPLKRTKDYEDLRRQLAILAKLPSQPAPKKLLDLKERFKNYTHEFLTCILYPDVPADNNKAERKLRHLVLKRKVSFGTKSKKGSQTFSINASVLLSWWWADRGNWFANVSKAMGT